MWIVGRDELSGIGPIGVFDRGRRGLDGDVVVVVVLVRNGSDDRGR